MHDEITLSSANQTQGVGSNASSLFDERALPLLESHPALAVPYILLTVLATLLGTGGNTLVLLVNALSQWQGVTKVGGAFIVNLAVADLCVTAIADPFCIIGVVMGRDFFLDKEWLCTAIAAFCLTACFCAFLSLTAITLNRYIYVCHNQLYAKLFSRRKNAVICATIWACALLMESPNFFGWGDHYFDMKNHSCIWNRTASLSYTLFVSMAAVGGPLLLMGVCHFKIFSKIIHSSKQVASHSQVACAKDLKIIDCIKSCRSVLIVFIVFVICWVPYALIVSFDVNNTFAMPVHLYFTLLAHMHSSAPFLVYWCTNSNFRKTTRRVLKITWGHSVGPTTSDQPAVQPPTSDGTSDGTGFVVASSASKETASALSKQTQLFLSRGPYIGE